MTNDLRHFGGVLSRKGEAKPPSEPAVRVRPALEGRRVGATLPTDLYVRFKAYVARHNLTGERAIVTALEHLLADG